MPSGQKPSRSQHLPGFELDEQSFLFVLELEDVEETSPPNRPSLPLARYHDEDSSSRDVSQTTRACYSDTATVASPTPISSTGPPSQDSSTLDFHANSIAAPMPPQGSYSSPGAWAQGQQGWCSTLEGYAGMCTVSRGLAQELPERSLPGSAHWTRCLVPVFLASVPPQSGVLQTFPHEPNPDRDREHLLPGWKRRKPKLNNPGFGLVVCDKGLGHPHTSAAGTQYNCWDGTLQVSPKLPWEPQSPNQQDGTNVAASNPGGRHAARSHRSTSSARAAQTARSRRECSVQVLPGTAMLPPGPHQALQPRLAAGRAPAIREAAERHVQWHSSALCVGTLTDHGHIFTKTKSEPRRVMNGYELSPLTILFEKNLHASGCRRYRYAIQRGEVGPADGVGFVFDNKIRRTNIQQMRSIFLNRHGQLCIRDRGGITKLKCSLPKLSHAISVTLTVDLESDAVCFEVDSVNGKDSYSARILHCSSYFTTQPCLPRSGFFCAIVTGNITVSLH